MHIGVEDYNFLLELEGELGQSEGWTPRVEALWELNERLKNQREAENEKQKILMRKKRAKNNAK